jgi:hypothetical protein
LKRVEPVYERLYSSRGRSNQLSPSRLPDSPKTTREFGQKRFPSRGKEEFRAPHPSSLRKNKRQEPLKVKFSTYDPKKQQIDKKPDYRSQSSAKNHNVHVEPDIPRHRSHSSVILFSIVLIFK